MAKIHICDVPGCDRTRARWHRLCRTCFMALPGDIRTGLADAHRQRRKGAWRGLCKQAAQHLGVVAPAQRAAAAISAATFQQRQAQLLGERDA